MVTIFTDGASRGNPGQGGFAAIILNNGMVREIGGREEDTTNNRMEMMASIEALKILPDETEAEIYTDSAYLLNGATKWVYGWQKNNWTTTTKEEVLNRDLWKELIAVSEGKKIKWHKLSGHSGVPANERCDVIATSFADNRPIKLFHGNIYDYGIDLNITEAKADASGRLPDHTVRRGKAAAYSYVSMINNIIKTHKTWSECEARVKGKSGARFKKAVSKEDEEKIISEFSKND